MVSGIRPYMHRPDAGVLPTLPPDRLEMFVSALALTTVLAATGKFCFGDLQIGMQLIRVLTFKLALHVTQLARFLAAMFRSG